MALSSLCHSQSLAPRCREPFNQVLRLAFHYKQLRAFVEGVRARHDGSAYLRALCSGIAGVLLEPRPTCPLSLLRLLARCPHTHPSGAA